MANAFHKAQKPLIVVAVALSAGCANYGLEKHFDRSTAPVPPQEAVEPGLATVYLVRAKAWGQSFIYVPIAPLYFGVNGQMLAVMPLGSHVRLLLPPGRHRFSQVKVAGGLLGNSVDVQDIHISVEAGRVYYAGATIGFPHHAFGPLEQEPGRKLVADSERAAIIHSPVSVATFTARVAAPRAPDRPTDTAASGPQSSAVGSGSAAQVNALPSRQQVGSFLEGLAAVALIGLAIFGAGAAMRSNAVPPVPTYSPPQLVALPAVAQAQPAQSSQDLRWKNSTGTLSEIVTSKERVTVRNAATGVTYEIEDGRIRGSDGSRYMVSGATIYSDTGKTYQVTGNTLWTSDGRSCVRTGALITC
jgi:hypothetical protein